VHGALSLNLDEFPKSRSLGSAWFGASRPGLTRLG
jgi:hypothetical protein